MFDKVIRNVDAKQKRIAIIEHNPNRLKVTKESFAKF